jgi:peptidoglycan glycosyltransferase
LGREALLQSWSRFGFDQALDLPLPIAAGVIGPLATDPVELRGAAAGQGNLTVTPLHMALVAGTIAQRGEQPQPYLIEAVEVEAAEGTTWQMLASPGANPVLGPAVAQALAAAMRQAVTDGAAGAAEVAGLEIAGHAGVALAGPNVHHAWFIGFAPAGAPRFAIAVLIEGSSVAAEAAQVGGEVLRVAVGEPSG